MKSYQPNLNELLDSLKIEAEKIDKILLTNALIHKSFRRDSKEVFLDNERLEYLGDAVLKLAVSKNLFLRLTEADEGEMSQIRAYVVSDKILAKIGRKINLGKYVLLSNRELSSGGKNKDSILANVLEAIFGAIFLSTDFETTAKVVIDLIMDELEEGINGKAIEENAKDLLQKITQERFKSLPDYQTNHIEGPAHKAVFESILTVNHKRYHGKGKSKKEAEQKAAGIAVKDLKNED